MTVVNMEVNVSLTENDLDRIRFQFVCAECKEDAEVGPSFFMDAGTPICGKDGCTNEGEDMDMVSATVSVRVMQ